MRGHYVGALIDVLEELGVDRQHFLARCGVAESELCSDNLLDLAQVRRINEEAIAACPDQPIGLEVGRRLNINTHGPLGYAAMASATYADALELLLKYYKVQAPRVQFAVRTGPDVFELHIDPSYVLPDQPWVTKEFLLTSIYASTEFLFCGHLPDVEVWLDYAPPPHADKYREVYKVPVRFSQPFCGLVIPAAMARQPLSSADPAAAQLFEKRCESMQKMVEHEDLPHRIQYLVTMSCPDIPTQQEIAERLHLSASTLHRKLSEAGYSYKELVSGVRKKLALQHLDAGELTIDEIAHLLGFSDASNFRRAFIAWTGQTPSQYRESGKEDKTATADSDSS